jgi:hypothetical protein
MTDSDVTLAFFRHERYLVNPETAAVVVVPDDSEPRAEHSAEGWEVVTRDELFERWPVWREKHEALRARLRDQGLA